ncbi:ORF121 [Lymantria xylina nucleopolyhedrovirus]|uniref:ORF121 n=1 Tax=Lymantria xylina multiple nucleopolyhedrovirus TaxID=2847840 RepID=D4N2F8_9ABAC|nr:ORF121 [Lymantria xylina nucleopolyhedrovirus]ADD73830.1 ORF121 [Lymantria xylina nucleopolyhedrovirus]
MTTVSLKADFTDYLLNVKAIVEFVKKYFKEDPAGDDYKRFADSVLKLLGDLIDDYVDGKLFASDGELVARLRSARTEMQSEPLSFDDLCETLQGLVDATIVSCAKPDPLEI